MGEPNKETEVAEDYRSALADLHVNSKPLITMLTMLADENKHYAHVITQALATHLKETTYKLPAMYLIDSIVKNVGKDYLRLFGNVIAPIFTNVFVEVDEKTRKKLYELRQTWNEVFPRSRLFLLDTNIHEVDPAWPITSQLKDTPPKPTGSKPASSKQSSTIYVNPLFKPQTIQSNIALQQTSKSKYTSASPAPPAALPDSSLLAGSNTHDMAELAKLQTEKRVLQETRKKVEKMMQANPKKGEVPNKLTTMDMKANPSHRPASNSPVDRRAFLSQYKIKKKSLTSGDKIVNESNRSNSDKVQNIHIAPWKAEQILPGITTTSPPKDPRHKSPLIRDPRVSQSYKDHLKESRSGGNFEASSKVPSRDPRIVVTSSKSAGSPKGRDPRLLHKPPSQINAQLSQTLTATSTTTTVTVTTTPTISTATTALSAIRDPRLAQTEKKMEPKLSQKERDLSKMTRELALKKDKDRKEKLKEIKIKEKEREKKKHEAKLLLQKKEADIKVDVNKKEKEKKKELIKEKQVEKQKVTPSKDNSKTGIHLKTKSKKDDSISSSPEDKQKPKIDIKEKSKRREHLRPRVVSPEENIKCEEPIRANTDKEKIMSSGSSTSSGGSSSGKRSRRDNESDSEDSDHYDGNKPSPASYANKRVKSDSVTSSPSLLLSSPNQSFSSSTTDTDLRQLAPQQENRVPVEVKEKEKLIDLFGKEDVDLRQLSMLARTAPASQAHPAGVLNPVFVKPDEDMRIQNNSMKGTPEGRENQDPRFSKLIEEGKMDDYHSPLRKNTTSILDELKKPFSSPHAAKWEKFREKNPQFKEYQRQASICERMDVDEPGRPSSTESHESVKSGFGKWERGRPSQRYKNESDRMEKPFDELEPHSDGDFSDDNYKFMINQLTDQHKKGEISSTEFSRCMEDIRLMVEQGKIRELQAKEREYGDAGFPPDKKPRIDEPNEDLWSMQGPESSQFHEDVKWEDKGNSRTGSWQRGRPYRSHHLPRNMGPRPGTPGHHARFEDEWTFEPDLPVISEDVLRTVYRESETRTIDIDSRPREIRTYGERAIILMDWNDPRTLGFEPVPCRIVFDGGQFVIPMSIGEDYRDFTIDGEVHRVRLGVPTQELMLDGKGYQCFFGGKPITVHLAGKNRTISLDGRPPKVNIGQKRNSDFLLGKIELILNAKKIIPLYLDAKPQRFNIDGKSFVIKFVDAFSAVNINGVKFPVEFGGLPISFSVRGCRRFLRFSSLPSFVIPGKTIVRGMDSEGDTLIPSYPSSPPPSDITRPPSDINRLPSDIIRPSSSFPSTPAIISIPPHSGAPRVPLVHPPVPIASGSSANSFPYQLQPLRPGVPQPVMIIPSGPPPPLPNIRGVVPGSYITSTGIPAVPLPGLPPVVPGGPNVPSFTQIPPQANTSVAPPPPAINVQDLLTRLVKTGIIGGGQSKKEVKKENKKEETKEENKEPIEEEEEEFNFLKELPPVESMFTLDNLRKRNVKLIKRMYRGMQCSSCGLRYPPESTQQYSHHLDWHFRMNKKQQDSTKKVSTRKFYLCVEDWVQYEEIEDIEERVPSMFEVEGQNTSNANDDEEDGEDIPSVAVSTDPSLGVCPICHETFDQFYHQTTEDWHYKYAIQVDGINYHPGCHQDHLKAIKQEEERIKKEIEDAKIKEEEEERLKEEEEAKLKLEEEEKKRKEEEEKEKERKALEEKVDAPSPDEIELEEIKMEDEDIQEIEKVKDEKPKVEIDLTEEEGKKVLKEELIQEEEDEQEEKEPKIKKSSLDKVKDALRNINAISNGIVPFRIKEEPMDTEGEMKVYFPPREPRLLADIPIKMEIDEEEENHPPSYDIEDDDALTDGESESPNSSWIAPATLNYAETDIASSIDGNTELSTSTPTQNSTSGPKIKISVSIPTKNNIEDHMNALNNGHKTDSSTELKEKTIEEFVPPPFTVDYNLKPGFKGVQLQEQPLALRGAEVSSLCSIM